MLLTLQLQTGMYAHSASFGEWDLCQWCVDWFFKPNLRRSHRKRETGVLIQAVRKRRGRGREAARDKLSPYSSRKITGTALPRAWSHFLNAKMQWQFMRGGVDFNGQWSNNLKWMIEYDRNGLPVNYFFFHTLMCICLKFCRCYRSVTMADPWTFNNKGHYCSAAGDGQCMFDLWELWGGVGDTVYSHCAVQWSALIASCCGVILFTYNKGKRNVGLR